MSTSPISSRFPDTKTIPADQWTSFCAEFTQRNRGAHARLEILDDEAGRLVETENRPFDGVAVDTKGSARMVWVTFAPAGDNLTHGVPSPTILRTASFPESGEVLEIESGDGSRTILTLSQPGDFALPA